MTFRLLLCLLIMLVSCNNSQDRLHGTWVLVLCNSKNIECPDVIFFKEDSTYDVMNDCYGEDIKLPLIENGSWVSVGDSIYLNRRQLSNDYFLFENKAKNISLYYEIRNNLMIVRFYNGTNLVDLCYKRRFD